MTSRANSWQQIRRKGWADEVDEDWGSSGDLASPVFDDATNHYRSADGVWHEDINVERGQSQHRLDLDSGFMRSIRQNQYARDEHEQAWQDAYGDAPPFQQKWGVGIKVQPQRRGKEGQWQHSQAPHGTTRREEQTEGAVDKPWWRKAADIQHASEVRILSRSEAERRAMPNRDPGAPHQSAEPMPYRSQVPETQHDKSSAVTHEALEAQLLRRNRASAEPRHPSYATPQGSRLSQQGPPLIDAQGVAMGIPVEWAMNPVGHTSGQPYTYSEVQQQDAPLLEAPRPVSAPNPEYHEEHVEAAVKPAKQEKVKMGFQLYRPPTILAQASSEAPPEKEETWEVTEQPRARGNSHAAPAAGRKPSRQTPQPQPQPQPRNTPLKEAAQAIHAAAKDRMAVPLYSSTTSLSGRETAKLQKGCKSNGPQRGSNDNAPAAREEAAERLPDSSVSTERRRARRPPAGVTKGEPEPQLTKPGRSNKDIASRQKVSDAREPTQQTSGSSRAKAQSRASSHADDSAQRQSSGRNRRAPAVTEKARQGSSAEQRSHPAEERAERPSGVRQRPDKASERPAGTTGIRESRAQPKQLLTELVKQATEFNASPVKKQPPAAQSTSRATSRTAAPKKTAKLAAPPGLEAVVPAVSRKAAARS